MDKNILILGICIILGICCVAQDDPQCDLIQIAGFVSSQTGDKWEAIVTDRNFSAVCSEVTKIHPLVKDCHMVSEILGLDSVADTTRGWIDRLTILDSYCGMAMPPRDDLCDWQSISTCAVSVIGTLQETINSDTAADSDTLCGYYNDLINRMDDCMNMSTQACTPEQKEAYYQQYRDSTSFLRQAQQACGDGCKDFIALALNEKEGCQYIRDYSTLQPSDYCTYVDSTINCVEDQFQTCAVFSPYITDQIGDTGVELACALGCTTTIFGVTCGDPTDSVIIPPCAVSVIECVKKVGELTGLTTDLGPDGGYNVNAVMDTASGYVDVVMAGQVEDICSGVQTVVNTVQTCVTDINAQCDTGTTGQDIENVVTDDILSNITEACNQDCADMFTMLAEVNTCGNSPYIDQVSGDVWGSIGDVVFGFVRPGGNKVALCQILLGYVECVVNAVKSCSQLYDNYMMFIERYSDLPYQVSLCGIEVDLGNGDVVINPNSVDPVLFVRGGASSVSSFSWIFILIVSVFVATLRL